jgi:hypothetical protein
MVFFTRPGKKYHSKILLANSQQRGLEGEARQETEQRPAVRQPWLASKPAE